MNFLYMLKTDRTVGFLGSPRLHGTIATAVSTILRCLAKGNLDSADRSQPNDQ
jgi:hypothetical protein